MTTIERISLQNFRGVKAEIVLDLSKNQSLLLYGDNGTGKSSVLDGVEWFITDAVTHLSGEEVETHGGIINALAGADAECFVGIDFEAPSISNKKLLISTKGKFKSQFQSPATPAQDILLKALGGEKLWIRNIDLVAFVLGTKTKRLNDLSAIIGFEIVSNTKATLRKTAYDLRTAIRTKNFHASIATEKETIAKNLGALVSDSKNFTAAAATMIHTLKPESVIEKISDIAEVIKNLSAQPPTSSADRPIKLNEVEATSQTLLTSFNTFVGNWNVYHPERIQFQKDAAKLRKLTVKSLLDAAIKLLADHPTDDCPLCLQVVSRDQLKAQIAVRLGELKQIQDESTRIETSRRELAEDTNRIVTKLESWAKLASVVEGEAHKSSLLLIQDFIDNLKLFGKGLIETASQQTCILDNSMLAALPGAIEEIVKIAKSQYAEALKTVKDARIEVASKLSIALNAFERHQTLLAESEVLTRQADSMDTIAAEFTARQKEGMQNFLQRISQAINEYYLFMNPDEKVDDIELVCLDDKNGEFSGVAVNFKFHGKPVDSARKYLSESHVNALGLCLFLATARTFNKQSKVLILDDVISSFDKNHRAMFARLLAEKFSDLQLVVLTHETEWYEYLASLVKGVGWKILRTQWDHDAGISLSVASGDLRSQIDTKIQKNDEADLGNLIRRYGERCLKEIALALEVPCSFRLNDRNEGRTFDELYGAIRGHLNKKASLVASSPEIARLASCQFFSNKASHDGYKPNIADLKNVALPDLDKFCGLFRCDNCNKYLNTEFENIPEKKITCRCGKKSLPWK